MGVESVQSALLEIARLDEIARCIAANFFLRAGAVSTYSRAVD